MTAPTYLPIEVRAFAPPKDWPSNVEPNPDRRDPHWRRQYSWVLLYDCETTTDHRQKLLFGVYQLCRIDWKKDGVRVVPIEEGMFLGDNAEHLDAGAARRARGYVRKNRDRPRVDLTDPDASPQLRKLTLGEFLELRYRCCYCQGAILGGFNLAFDETSIASMTRRSRTPGFGGGFSVSHHTFVGKNGLRQASLWRPRTDIRNLDSKRGFFGFKRPKFSEVDHTKGKFLDLRMLAFAQTSEGHSLDSACDAYGVEGKSTPVLGTVSAKAITYCRDDVDATRRLLEAALHEHSRRGIDLAPHFAFSPASYGKAAIAQMGCRPLFKRQPNYPRDILGASVAGFYGARTECKIRAFEVPVIMCDFLAQYSTVCVLTGAWRFFTAKHIRHTPVDPGKLERWLAELTLEDLYDPKLWRRLNVLCWPAVDHELLVPVRARYDPDSPNTNIALSHLRSSAAMPYYLADLVVMKLLTGRTPKIDRAIRFTPVGTQPGLKPLRIPGAGKVDPYRDDYFQRLVELREKVKHARHLKSDKARTSASQSLKILSSATGYGINAETNPENLRKRIPVPAWGLDAFTAHTQHPETPGEFSNLPLAGMITAGGRLLLGMFEAEITRLGGIWAMADTDAMAVVATLYGGLIPCPGGTHQTEDGEPAIKALSHREVETITEGFRRLNPYTANIIDRSILEIEDVNRNPDGSLRSIWCFSLAAKRYSTYLKRDDGSRELTEKFSEHGLGHLTDPRDLDQHQTPWAVEVWQWILAAYLDDTPPPMPYWGRHPAVTQRTISTPGILELFDPKLDVRAFGFVNHVQLHGHEQHRQRHRERFDLIAPYTRDPHRWEQQTWIDTETASTHNIATLSPDGLVPDADRVLVRSYADILDSYARKAEPKALGPDDDICHSATRGVLSRRHVRNLLVTHRGKESNPFEPTQPPTSDQSRLDDREARIWQQIVHPVINLLPIAMVAEATDIPRHAIKDLRTRQAPRRERLKRLLEGLAPIARECLETAGQDPSDDDLTALAQFRDLAEVRVCRHDGAASELVGRV